MLTEKDYLITIREDLHNTRQYRISQEISYTLEDFQYHNEIETDLSLTLVSKTETGHVFEIGMLKQWQLKTDGLDRWDKDMAPLRKNLQIETDLSGTMRQVLNIEEVKDLWQELRPAVAEKYAGDEESKTVINASVALLYAPGELEKVLQSSYLYHAVLPGLYHQKFDRQNDFTLKGSRVVPNAIGTASLPFNTQIKLQQYDPFTEECQLKISGQIDQDALDKDNISALLRGLTDIYNLKTEVQGFHMEDYSFDRFHWIKESAQLTQYAIEGSLMFRNLCTLKLLNN